MKITIPGKPIAKKRPRFARRGKFVMTYNDQETEEGRFLLEVKQQWKEKPIEGNITLRVAFIMPRPKSHYGTGKNSGAPKPSAPTYHTQKPDLDNLVKFVKDCLNGVCWRDDSQVVSLIASKSWGPEGLTEISLS